MIPMMVAYRIALFLLALAEWPQTAAAELPAGSPSLDSISLERSPCIGSCPAYRLILSRHGVLVFVSRSRGDTIRDSIAPSAVAWLRDEAERRELSRLPTIISRDRALCPTLRSDAPTATVTLYWATRRHHIVDYLGCFLRAGKPAPRLSPLRRFEAAIDGIARTSRKLRRRVLSPPT